MAVNTLPLWVFTREYVEIPTSASHGRAGPGAIDGYELTLFPDARAIIKGVKDPDKARTLYAKYVGA